MKYFKETYQWKYKTFTKICEEEVELHCGDAFCEYCGDCIYCFADDCFDRGHAPRWIVYLENDGNND